MNHPDLTKIPIIAFSGKAKSGKDTALEAIRKEVSLDRTVVLRINFADALKEEVAKACNGSVEAVDKNKDIFRPMLQWWGTDFRRKMFYDHYWLKRWEERRDRLVCPGVTQLIVCTDVRFLNEVEFMKSLGAKVIRIIRPTPVATAGNHASETDLDNYKEWDGVIINSSTLLTFEHMVVSTINKLNNK